MTIQQLESLFADYPRDKHILFKLGDLYVPILHANCRHIGYDVSRELIIVLSNSSDIERTSVNQDKE